MASYDTRLAQVLAQMIAQDLTDAHNALGSGSLIVREDAAATGMNCARHMGVILGLETAMRRITQAEEELSGRSRPGTHTGKDGHDSNA